MARIIRLAVRSAYLAVLLTLTSASWMAGVNSTVLLTGRWIFNPSLSDKADQKIQQAKKLAQSAQGGPNAIGAIGGVSDGGSGLGAGGDTWDGPTGPNFKEKIWTQLAENPKYLQIVQHPDQIIVTNDSGQAQNFYADGEKHDQKNADGKKVTITAGWQGDSFVAISKLGHSKTLTLTFNLKNDGKQLDVTTRYDIVSLSEPVIIRRAYDLAPPPAQ